jgi:hypothetical protein
MTSTEFCVRENFHIWIIVDKRNAGGKGKRGLPMGHEIIAEDKKFVFPFKKNN